jgi:hypothetical protein
LAFKILLCEPTVFRDPSFGFCLGIKFAEITGRAVRPRPGHLHAPMTPRLDWLHYKIGTHQSDGTFHSLCQRSKIRTTITEHPGEKNFLHYSHCALLPKPKCDEERQGEGEERKGARAENGRSKL